jgi:hypothetical protein
MRRATEGPGVAGHFRRSESVWNQAVASSIVARPNGSTALEKGFAMRCMVRSLVTAVGLAAALLAAGGYAAARAQDSAASAEAILEAGESQPGPPGTVLDAVLRRDIGGVVDYLRAGRVPPAKIGARAVAVIKALRGQIGSEDAAGLRTSVAFVSQLAAEAVCAPQVIRAAIEPSYLPPPSRPHLDFGGWTSRGAPGWAQLTASAPELQGLRLAALDRVGRGAVFSDAIDNVEHFAYAVPNGRYRLALLTPEPVIPQVPNAPFGQRLFVNGVPFALGDAPASTWLDGGRISNRAVAGQPVKGKKNMAAVAGTGGMILLDVEVANGILEMHFLQPPPARGARLSGLIIEPVGGPSAVVLQGEAKTVLQNLEPSCREHGRQATAAVRAAARQALEG